MSNLLILRNREWYQANIVGYGTNGQLQDAVLEQPYVSITVDGISFAPLIEVVTNSSAIIVWKDLDTGEQLATGTAPNIVWESNSTHKVGLRVETFAGTPLFSDVLTLNFGFNSGEDAGQYNIGSSYNHMPQQMMGISGLNLLTGLKRFLAADTPLTGTVDFSGLSELEFIECYNAHVQVLNLTGCTSLIRLCMERNYLTELDLNPVRSNLRDLRAAVQHEGAAGGPWSLTFATLSGPMDLLYHYCIRDQTVHNIIPHAQLPVIEEHWAWNTGQTISDAPTSTLLRSYVSYGNPYDQASVDLILTTLATLITNGTGRNVDVSGGSVPSVVGQTAITTLESNGWTVNVAE